MLPWIFPIFLFYGGITRIFPTNWYLLCGKNSSNNSVKWENWWKIDFLKSVKNPCIVGPSVLTIVKSVGKIAVLEGSKLWENAEKYELESGRKSMYAAVIIICGMCWCFRRGWVHKVSDSAGVEVLQGFEKILPIISWSSKNYFYG